jgi:Zn-finger nucleic acid-binding protein
MHVVECPRCGSSMKAETFDAHVGRRVTIDICQACQSFWFDTHESAALTPGSTLRLFRVIGEKIARPERSNADLAKCPRCKSRLRRTHDIQRTTKFEYLSCPHGHGRLTTFFDFLREKDFIRPLTPQQIEELRRNVGSVNCANCGAPVDVTAGAACAHCRTPLSMLDLRQAERLVAQLQKAEDRAGQPVDPALPLELERVRRQTERAFVGFRDDDLWSHVASTAGKADLVVSGLTLVAHWLKGDV